MHMVSLGFTKSQLRAPLKPFGPSQHYGIAGHCFVQCRMAIPGLNGSLLAEIFCWKVAHPVTRASCPSTCAVTHLGTVCHGVSIPPIMTIILAMLLIHCRLTYGSMTEPGCVMEKRKCVRFVRHVSSVSGM